MSALTLLYTEHSDIGFFTLNSTRECLAQFRTHTIHGAATAADSDDDDDDLQCSRVSVLQSLHLVYEGEVIVGARHGQH